MARIQISGFLGERPRMSAALLPTQEATEATNVHLTSGRLEPVRAPLIVPATLNIGGQSSIYKMSDGATDYWLSWPFDVDVARNAHADEDTFRVCFTGDQIEPRTTDRALATTSTPYPTNWYKLGVTPPNVAANVAASGGSGTAEDRAYVHTFVTEWGEESAPSPASTILTGKVDDTWTVSNMPAPPLNSMAITNASWAAGLATYTVASTFGLRVGEYVTISGMTPALYDVVSAKITAITATTVVVAMESDPGTFSVGGTLDRDAPHHTANMTRRVYRSVTSGTDPDYYFISEVPVATTSVDDTPSTVLGESLPSGDWSEPPVGLRGIKALPSGGMVGFAGNVVYMSEPRAPYAWPDEYKFSFANNVVGLGVINTSVVVVTDGLPYVLTGLTPDTTTPEQVNQQWAGQSKRSIVEAEAGVIWATELGLVQYGLEAVGVITRDHFTQKEWAAVPSEQFSSAYHDGRYYGSYVDGDGFGRIFIFDMVNGGVVSSATVDAECLWEDENTNRLYIAANGSLYEWDSDDGRLLSMAWQSKRFLFPHPINMAVAQVEADFAVDEAEQLALAALIAALIAENQALIAAQETEGAMLSRSLNTYSLNGSAVKPLHMVGSAGARILVVDFYVGGKLYHSATITSTFPFRLPRGSLYSDLVVRVSGPAEVDSIRVATSMLELRE